ncbi:O-antigen translocase [Flavobacterium sp.]
MKSLKQNKLLKVLSLNSISVAISFVLGIISSKIISVFLGASGMALMGSFRNFTSMAKSVSTLGINNSVVKLIVENKEDKKELGIIYSTFFWLFLFISITITTLVLIFASSISSFIFYSDGFTTPIRFFGLLLPLLVINTFWLAIYNGFEHFKKIVIIQIIANVLTFVTTALLIWKQNIIGGLFSIALGELLMVLVTFLFIKKEPDFFKFDLKKVLDKKYLRVIKRFLFMALLSAVLVPLTLLLIRDAIVSQYSINDAGIWDAVNRLSNFYMMFFSSGLSLYYMPKLAALVTENEFKTELKSYFKIIVPLFALMLLAVYFSKELILKIAFTNEFSKINELIIWQLLGDFIRIMTLAFGFQILVKTMLKRYFITEIIFNGLYFFLSVYLMKINGVAGVLQAYFIANSVTFVLILFMFRKLFFKSHFSKPPNTF